MPIAVVDGICSLKIEGSHGDGSDASAGGFSNLRGEQGKGIVILRAPGNEGVGGVLSRGHFDPIGEGERGVRWDAGPVCFDEAVASER